MKLTFLLLTVALLQVSAKTTAQNITYSGKDVSLEEVFAVVKKQTGFVFFYNYELLSNAKKVTLTVKDASLQEVLGLCFKEQPLDFVIENKTVIVTEKALPTPVSPSVDLQSTASLIDITGKVTDTDNKPLEGATVKIKGTRLITTTNSAGVFAFTSIDEKAILEISFVGFETQTVAVKTKTFIAVTMKKSESPLDEVQVIAYGTTSKRLNTGNVVTVKEKDIEKSPVSNPLLALQGRVTGMEIVQTNGLPGSGVTVRIRGQNSIDNGNDPLYVIDGVPYLSQMLPGLGGITGQSGGSGIQSGSTGNPLSYINPGDIESIDILKDADATAIYGSRGANGVVLITTKKGKSGPMHVDLNVQQGWGRVSRFIPWLNKRQYLDIRYEAYKNDGVDISTLTPAGDNYDLTVWDTTRNTDWNKTLIGSTANYSNIQLSLTGGSNNMGYRIGYNYNKQTTVFPGSFGDPKGSLSFSINNSSNNKKLQVQLSGNYQVDNNELPDYDLTEFTKLVPNAPELHNSDGSLNWAIDSASGTPTWNNPLAYLNSKYKRRVNNLVFNAVFSYQLSPSFQIKASGGFTSMQSSEIRTNPASLSSPIFSNSFERSSRFSATQNDSWIIEPQLNYMLPIAGGELNALIGITVQQNSSQGQALSARGFNSDLVIEDAKAANSVQVESSLDAIYKYNAFFGRLNYNLKNKYLINLTARRDGTSRFGPDKQFANFGAVGLGWVFSKESIIKNNLPFLSFGKLRGSYGTTGSDQVGDYRFLNLYNYNNYDVPYQNSLSLLLNGLYNADLAWEETKKIEAAIELGFCQDRITLSASYYRNRSSNQLTSRQLPLNTGSTSVPANLDATVQNTGLEFTISTSNIQSATLQWTSSMNLSIPRNKLISLTPSAYFIDKRLVGQPLATTFVYGYAGVDPATGQYQFYNGKGGITFSPDTAYDPVTYNSYSQHPLHTSVQFFGGLQNSISWKGVTVDFLLQFEKRLGSTNERGNYPGSFSSNNQPVSVLNRWQNAGDNASTQRFNQDYSIYHSVELLESSDANYMDASFVRLENVSLSWQIPARWKQKMHLQTARIYTQAQNLFVITNYKGSDPETRSLITLPPLKVWTIGLQLSF